MTQYISLLDEAMKEALSHIEDSSDAWQAISSAPADTQAWSRSFEGVAAAMFKVRGRINGVRAQQLQLLLADQTLEERQKYDEHLESRELLEEFDDVVPDGEATRKATVKRTTNKKPAWGITPRCVLTARRIATLLKPSVRHLSMERSVEHEKYPEKDEKKYVRAHLLMSTTVFEDDPEAPEDEPVTIMSFIIQLDACGMIPAFVLNSQKGRIISRIEKVQTIVAEAKKAGKL